MKTVRALYAGSDSVLRAGEIFRDFCASHGVTVELLSRGDLTAETLADAAWEWHADFVRCDFDLGSEWLSGSPVQPLAVSLYQAADAFVRKGKTWEPELLIEPALRENLVRRGHHLDLRASAYIVGEGLCARVVCGVVVGLGYRRVCLVGPTIEDVRIQRDAVAKIFVGVDIETISEEALTLQTTGASLLINALDLTHREDLAADLAYFNFMNAGGLVVDMSGARDERLVLAEAARAGLRTVPQAEIAATREWRLIELCGLDVRGSFADFVAAWTKASEER